MQFSKRRKPVMEVVLTVQAILEIAAQEAVNVYKIPFKAPGTSFVPGAKLNELTNLL